MFKYLAMAALFALPLMAQAKDSKHNLTNKDVAGTYVSWGFSNSIPTAGSATSYQSLASISRTVMNADGTGTLVALDEVVLGPDAPAVNDVVPGNPVNLPFTYQLNYQGVPGYTLITLPHFPTEAQTTYFLLHFKVQCGKVVGYYLLAPTPLQVGQPPTTSLWFLSEGFKLS